MTPKEANIQTMPLQWVCCRVSGESSRGTAIFYLVDFDDGGRVIYDVGIGIDQIPAFSNLRTIPGLFANARLDSSRTIAEWSDEIDLPSDMFFEYGQKEPCNG